VEPVANDVAIMDRCDARSDAVRPTDSPNAIPPQQFDTSSRRSTLWVAIALVASGLLFAGALRVPNMLKLFKHQPVEEESPALLVEPVAGESPAG
jgi:hypothetical protein